MILNFCNIFIVFKISTNQIQINRRCLSLNIFLNGRICRPIIFHPPTYDGEELKHYGEDKNENNYQRNISFMFQI